MSTGKAVPFIRKRERTVHIVHANGVVEDAQVPSRTDDEALAHVFQTRTFVGMPQEVSVKPYAEEVPNDGE